jgi:UDP-glucose 6-dehydrogenase
MGVLRYSNKKIRSYGQRCFAKDTKQLAMTQRTYKI